jgi:hypothetical protein
MAPSAQNTGLLGAVGATVRLTPPGLAGFGIQITGTWAGTVQFEGSLDGVTFQPLSATLINGTVPVVSATVNGLWQAASPLVSMQVRLSAWTSGLAVVTLNAVEAATGGAAAGGGGGGGGAVTIADGADAATGSTTDAAVVGDNAGTVSSKLRGINKILADVWDSLNHRLHVVVDNTASIPVTITGGSTGNGAASNTGAAVPTQADYGGVNIGGTLRGVTAVNPSGTVYAQQMDVASVNGATVVTGHGPAAGALRVELPTDGTGVVTATQATASALNATVVGAGSAGTPTGGVVTVQGAASMTKLLVTPDSVALPANQSVNVAQVGGTNTVTAGLAGTLAVGGTAATNVAIGSNPLNTGAQAVSAENSAVTTGRMVQLVADLVGKLIVLPYANPENFVAGAITTAMTATTSTSLVAAPAAGLRNYITQITVSNAHATVGTDIVIQDGSGGATLYTIPAAAGYGGATLTFPVPLRQPTTATALFCANVTTGASTKVSASGYKGA